MYRVFTVIFILISIGLHGQISNPVNPSDPKGDSSSVSTDRYNIEFKKEDGFFYKAYAEGMNGFYLDGLTWEGNESGSRKIMIDFVKSVTIKGYKINIRTFDKLSLVYYVPHIFDIEMKNGQVIRDAKGVIRQLDAFDVFDEVGKERVFTYFVRYWQEDKMIFSDNGSSNFNETPAIPKQVVTYIEFK